MINLKKKSGTSSSKVITVNDIKYISFPILENTGIVKHGLTTRLGGVSKGIYSSMNLSFTRGDDPENVLENYKRISKAMGFDYGNIVSSDQTHTTNIRLVTSADKGKGITRKKDYHDIDGLITSEADIPLVTLYADCVPIYFIDPIKKAIGLSHSGWKGTVEKIADKTIRSMNHAFGSRSSDIIACIGPSICQECYEVSEDVAIRFYENFSSTEIDNIIYKKNNNKYQLDLWKANETILTNAGILPENIASPDICTCCNKDILFSHRALGGKRGNIGAFLMLKS